MKQITTYVKKSLGDMQNGAHWRQQALDVSSFYLDLTGYQINGQFARVSKRVHGTQGDLRCTAHSQVSSKTERFTLLELQQSLFACIRFISFLQLYSVFPWNAYKLGPSNTLEGHPEFEVCFDVDVKNNQFQTNIKKETLVIKQIRLY